MSEDSLKLPRRPLGETKIDVSVLGLGGFHQVEAMQDTIDRVVARYLDAGGNYIETARGYGGGASEIKLGNALQGIPRTAFVLASKSSARDAETAWRDINDSLENLRTDHIDIYFFHNIGTEEDLTRTTQPGGALEAFTRARQEGLVRFFGMSSHWPMMYVNALDRLPLDAVLVWGNYLDFCNFPEIPRIVLPALRRKGIGVLFMKPVADGYLYRSPQLAFPYALAQDTDCLVAGFNSLEMLEQDITLCCGGEAGPDDIQRILTEAPELGNYVCRQCDVCRVHPGPTGEAVKRVFELEGKVDRQMDPRRPLNAADYALKERLKGWFGTAQRARDMYRNDGIDAETSPPGRCSPARSDWTCPANCASLTPNSPTPPASSPCEPNPPPQPHPRPAGSPSANTPPKRHRRLSAATRNQPA